MYVCIYEAWYLASAPGRCHCICRPYDWNDVASALSQVALHYHRKTGIHYIHLWTSPISFTLSLLPTRWSHSWLELFQTLKPNPQKLTCPRYLPANPNPYWPASPVSKYRQNVVFHQYGTYTDIFHLPLRALPVWGLFFWNLKISFSAKLGLAIKSHSFLPKVAAFKVFSGASYVRSYALFQADSNITISFNN